MPIIERDGRGQSQRPYGFPPNTAHPNPTFLEEANDRKALGEHSHHQQMKSIELAAILLNLHGLDVQN